MSNSQTYLTEDLIAYLNQFMDNGGFFCFTEEELYEAIDLIVSDVMNTFFIRLPELPKESIN
jgi:hypothetical protein